MGVCAVCGGDGNQNAYSDTHASALGEAACKLIRMYTSNDFAVHAPNVLMKLIKRQGGGVP